MKQADLFGERAPEASPKAAERESPQPASPAPPPVVKVEVVAPPPQAVVEARAPSEPAWRRPVERRVVSVSELTAEIKGLLEPRFTRVLVRGEVSGFRGPNSRGHLYFSIKDRDASIGVTMWQSSARALKFALRDGLSVLIEGELNVYEPSGRYSLIAQRLEPEGVGARALAFEQLKQRLAQEGLLGERRSKPRRTLAALPKRVGVATSVSGAALRDFLKVLHRRNPRVSVVVCDARVQGDGAAWEVARAIRWLNNLTLDAIIVTRGGGSVDDLWTFNEEPVARAIFACQAPVISAVGHEIDTTLADLVADVRAPTPSAAAEAVTPVLADLELGLAALRARLRRAVEKQVLRHRSDLKGLKTGLGDPRRRLTQQRLRLSEAADRLARVVRRRLRDGAGRTRELGLRLQRARPQAQLRARRATFEALSGRLYASTPRRLRAETERLTTLRRRLERLTPRPALQREQQRVLRLRAQLATSAERALTRARDRWSELKAKLDALSPLKVLGRGYAIAQRVSDGRVVRSANDAGPGDQLTLRLGAGDSLQVRVMQVKPGAP